MEKLRARIEREAEREGARQRKLAEKMEREAGRAADKAKKEEEKRKVKAAKEEEKLQKEAERDLLRQVSVVSLVMPSPPYNAPQCWAGMAR